MFRSGEIQYGDWMNGDLHGYGVSENNDKHQYEGEWYFSDKSGYGEEIILGDAKYYG